MLRQEFLKKGELKETQLLSKSDQLQRVANLLISLTNQDWKVGEDEIVCINTIETSTLGGRTKGHENLVSKINKSLSEAQKNMQRHIEQVNIVASGIKVVTEEKDKERYNKYIIKHSSDPAFTLLVTFANYFKKHPTAGLKSELSAPALASFTQSSSLSNAGLQDVTASEDKPFSCANRNKKSTVVSLTDSLIGKKTSNHSAIVEERIEFSFEQELKQSATVLACYISDHRFGNQEEKKFTHSSEEIQEQILSITSALMLKKEKSRNVDMYETAFLTLKLLEETYRQIYQNKNFYFIRQNNSYFLPSCLFKRNTCSNGLKDLVQSKSTSNCCKTYF